MKNSGFFFIFMMLFMPFMLSSCAAIAGIFKAGMGFGIFAVIGLLMLIIFVLTRIFKRKT